MEPGREKVKHKKQNPRPQIAPLLPAETDFPFYSEVTATPMPVKTREPAMLGPRADLLLIGGASIVLYFLYYLFVGSTPSQLAESLPVLVYFLFYAVNLPHFAASYQLLYVDHRKLIFRDLRFFWAAVVVPVLLAAGIAFAIRTANAQLMALLAQGMFLAIGWHYVKQAFHAVVLASAVHNYHFSKLEKAFLLLNLHSIWAVAWISANLSSTKETLNGVSYLSMGLPDDWLTIAYLVTAVTLMITVWLTVRRYVLAGQLPAAASAVAFGSIYLWYIPAIAHPTFFYFVPVFHALQNWLFVGTLKKNQAEDETRKMVPGPSERGTYVRKVWGFYLFSVLLSVAFFELVPRDLDVRFPIGSVLMGTTLWYFAFNLFLNIHHYFIDDVIWAGDGKIVQNHVVSASQET